MGSWRHHFSTSLSRLTTSSKLRHKLAAIIHFLIYPVALLEPLFDIPQLLEVWVKHQTAGVSPLTWWGYTFGAFVWLYYGFRERDKVIILSEILFLLLDGSVALGVLLIR